MNQKNYLIIGGAFIALIALFYFWGSRNQKPRFDWNESDWEKRAYSEQNDQPYGTAVFHQFVDGYFDNQPLTDIKGQLVKQLPADSNATKGTYVFIGGGMYLDSADTQHLMRFVEMGNTALIISKTIPFDLMNYIYYEECEDVIWDDYQFQEDTFNYLHLLSPDSVAVPQASFMVQNKPNTYAWPYIPGAVFCEGLPQQPIGFQNDSLVNFAVFPHGKGRFLLHTTPIAFSNYHLLKPEFQQYSTGVLSHINEGPVWWDAFNRVPESVARRRNNRHSMSNDLPEEHVLSYILKQEPLAWAWYLLIGLAVLYLVFRTLRRQRPIPVLAQNENSSFEFINTIAHLHFREKNYKGISMQAMRLFLSQIREKYGMSIGLDPLSNLPKIDDTMYRRLAARSEVPETTIKDIMEQYMAIARFEPTEQHMIDFYLSLDNFWKTAK
jgi:hypothetical protein